MKVFKIEFKRRPEGIKVIPIYDVHFGSVFHDEVLFNKTVKYIQENDDCFWFCGGDLLEFIPLGDKRFEFSNVHKDFVQHVDRILTYSIEYATEMLKPIANKCLFMISGNHDMKYNSKFGVDPIRTIAQNLDINNYTNNYEAFSFFMFKYGRTDTSTIYVHHGVGSSIRPGNLLHRLEYSIQSFKADVYISGHSHQLVFAYKPQYQLTDNGNVLIKKNKLLLRVGGFRLSRANNVYGYEERLGYYPNAVGTFILSPKIRYAGRIMFVDWDVFPLYQ